MEAVLIHVVTAENRALYEREMRDIHRIRHDIYVVERKWKGMRSQDGLEYDDFDNDYAINFVAIEHDQVVGGTRLYPTLQSHMLSTVCPELAEVRGIPRGPDIYEWTRLFAIKARREGRYGGGLVGQLWAGVLEYALAEGISTIQFCFEAWWLPRLQQMGWKVSPLGLPALINEEWWLAATFAVTPQLLNSIRDYQGITRSVLVRHGLPEPAEIEEFARRRAS
jgi:acyl-homoserine lactone synthase